jgi:hypothetical protein
MGKLTGIEEEVNKMLEPSSMDLLQDAVWRPDWLK